CGLVPHHLQAAETLWLRTSDHVRLFALKSGSGPTGVVLAHEARQAGSAVGCGRFRPLRPTECGCLRSTSAASRRRRARENRKLDDFAPDLQAAVDTLHADGASKVFVAGASFGGAVALSVGSRLRGVAGFVSLSGELLLPA